ncbi:MAG TPA: type II secretion system F family protein [Candidatus Acidoferrales bacterium]|nr:type II secretion system F family protein [Candidatus Acidoferrales bacterium]
MALLIALLTFLIVTIVFAGFWLFFGTTTNQELVRNRLEAVRKAEKGGDVSLDLDLVRDELLSSVPALNRIMMRLAWSKRLQDLITQAGIETKPGTLLLVSGVTGLGSYVIVEMIKRQFSLSFLAAVVGAIIPLTVVSIQRSRRLGRFEQRFPEALDLLGRAVRAGHSFTAGLEMVSKESPEPVASEFRLTFEEQNFGLPLRDALENMASRVPLVDVRFFITALLIQKDTGGNLAELLDELARVIRERFRIHREVRVKTAQGRLTAMILIALPIGMLLLMRAANPSYVRVLFDDPLGPKILAGAAALQVIGSAIIWKIVHIEV